MTRTLVLASASPARLRLLRDAGFAPRVDVSGVVEDRDDPLALAVAKARTVAERHENAVVIGCDSMLWFDGAMLGKPPSPDEARRRWIAMRGHAAVLTTGHAVIDTARDLLVTATVSTTVHFASISTAEIDAYVATGEPLAVAGGFTIDGRGALFVERIEGDHSNVIGLSLPALRLLLEELEIPVMELWP